MTPEEGEEWQGWCLPVPHSREGPGPMADFGQEVPIALSPDGGRRQQRVLMHDSDPQ